MALNLNGGRMVPDYGSDAPVVPLEKGNIDITANGYAGHLKSAYGSMMIATDGKMYTLIPKVDPIGNPMEDDVAYKLFRKTGAHLGQFASEEEASVYSKWLRGRAKEIKTYLVNDVPVSTSGDPLMMDVESIDEQAKMARGAIRLKVGKFRGMSAKGLGQAIRAVSEPFDPNAFDGDNDGIVQDGTQWARPSLPGAPVIASMRSLGGEAPFVPETTRRAAKAMSDVYKSNEPRITKRMKQIEGYAEGSAKLVDLDTRLKDVDSLASKIERLKGSWGNDVTAAASQMNDGLRYTFVVKNMNEYSGFAKAVSALLRAEGHRVTAWNYWGSKDPYQGVNMMVQDTAGFNYEIQFHTPESHSVKKKLEPLYKKFRDETNPSKRKEIYDRMKGLSGSVPEPPAVASIGKFIERGSTAARFTPEMERDALGLRVSNASMRSRRGGDVFTSFDDLPDIEKERRGTEVRLKGRKVLTGVDRGEGPLSGKPLFARGSGEVPLSEDEKQRIADSIVRGWLQAASAYVYGKYYWQGGEDPTSGNRRPPMHPEYGQTTRFRPGRAGSSALEGLGPKPLSPLIKPGGKGDRNKITSQALADEATQMLMLSILDAIKELVGDVPANLFGLDSRDGSRKPKYNLTSGDWSFLSWVPSLAFSGNDSEEDAKRLQERWDELTELINPELKFKAGSTHPFSRITKKEKVYDKGTGTEKSVVTERTTPNDLNEALRRIAQTVRGAYGLEESKARGEYEDPKTLKYVIDPETGLPKIDKETGRRIKIRRAPTQSLNQPRGRDRDDADEMGDSIEGNIGVGPDSGTLDAEQVVDEFGEELATELGTRVSSGSDRDYVDLPEDADNDEAYRALLQGVEDRSASGMAPMLQEMYDSAPKFTRMLMDRYLYSGEFSGDPEVANVEIAKRHGVPPSNVRNLFGTGTLQQTDIAGIGLLDVNEETGNLRFVDTMNEMRAALPQIEQALRNAGSGKVGTEEIIDELAKRFGIPERIVRSLYADISGKTGFSRVMNRELASQESVLDLVGSLAAQGQGRQSILNALYLLLKPEKSLPQKVGEQGVQDVGNTNRQIAQELSKLLGRPVTAGILNAVFQELGIDITQNGKADEFFSSRPNQRFVLRYSAKSAIGVFEGQDEVAIPPDL